MLKYILYVTVTASIFVASESTDSTKPKKKCNKPNEVLDLCPAKCPFRTCGIDDNLFDCMPSPVEGDPDCPPPTCRCKNGYYKDDKGNCVKWEDCPICDKPNEEYDPCPAPCPARRCDVDVTTILCQPSPQLGDSNCMPGCRCLDNYARNDSGTCIPKNQCPPIKPVCGPNEEYDPCPNCDPQTCETIGKEYHCPITTTKNCKGSCRCKTGFFRRNGICVTKEQCNQIKECKKNERLVECPAITCLPQNCSQAGYPVACPRIINGKCPDKPACLCIDGYLRNSKGICIPKENCPSCGGDPNARPGCGVNYGKRCSTYKQKDDAMCPAGCDLNGCDCTGNTVYDDNTGKCVPPKKCSPQCGKNEILSTCANGGCDRRNCSQLSEPIICKNLIKCESGCVCQEKYLRADNGTCVPENLCKTPKCPDGEIYSDCPPIKCDAEYCPRSINDLLRCPIPKKCGLPRCICGFNRHRDRQTGKCIQTSECPPFPCDGRNEHYDSCPPERLGDQCQDYINNSTCPKFGRIGSAIPCEPKCRCNKGTYRNIKGDCVSGAKCLQEAQCKENEQFVDCPAAICAAQSCSQAGIPIDCPVIPEGECPDKPGCICIDGYMRNSKGICIPKENCPSCGGDPNAQPGCGSYCNNGCPDGDEEPRFCIQACRNNGCDCKPNYLFDGKQGKCVLPENCTLPICKTNEVYSTCTQAVCRQQNCTERGKPVACPLIAEGFCEKGCVCAPNYLRDSSGTCVPEKQCDAICPKGEYLSDCPPSKCDAEYCPKSRNDSLSCPIPKKCGPARCICEFNKHRNRINGKCIQTSECPPFPCDRRNEYYDPCPPICPGEKCSDYINNSTCPKFGKIGIVILCKPECRCNKGTYRNSKGQCVSGVTCVREAPSRICTDHKPKDTPTGEIDSNIDKVIRALEQGNMKFTKKFLYQVVKNNPDESVIMSAFSVLIPLAQLALFTSGASLKQLLAVFNLENKDQIRSAFPVILKQLQTIDGNNTVKLGAKVYVNDKYPITKKFESDSQLIANSKAENIDVSNPKKASEIINDWAKEITNGKIQDLVSSDMITALTRLILVNGIYFKGTWKIQFDPKNTKERNFYVTRDETIQVKAMQVKDKFKYAESSELNAKLIELPYVGEEIKFIGILPNEIGGLDALVAKIKNSDALKNAVDDMQLETVTVTMPTMDVNTKIDLKKILLELNVSKIFNPGESGLDGILQQQEDLYVSEGVQMTSISMNENGSEAASANAFTIVALSASIGPPKPVYYFNVDHPMVYYITYKNLVLFAGTVVRS